jgi:hypothetical protein
MDALSEAKPSRFSRYPGALLTGNLGTESSLWMVAARRILVTAGTSWRFLDELKHELKA